MFSIGQTALAMSPFLRDIKLGVIKYQKYMFKKNLEKIFGFKLENPSFKLDDSKKDYLSINQEYFDNREKARDNLEKEFANVCYLGDLSNINYINYDISVIEDD